MRGATSVNQLVHGPRLAFEFARYVLTGRGAFTFGVTTALAFVKSREGLETPDIQLSFTPMSRDPAIHKFDELEREPGAPSRSVLHSRKAEARFSQNQKTQRIIR